MAPRTAPQDEIISASDVVKVKRGRKAVLDPTLLESIGKLTPGQALRLAGAFGEVPADKRSTVSQQIRKHFSAAHPDGKCSVNYTPQGVPQVTYKA